MQRLRRLLGLPGWKRALLLQAWLLLGLIRLGLGRVPYPVLRRRLHRWTGVEKRGRRASAGVAQAEKAAAVSWAVETAARRIPGATCLCQALAAEVLLLRRGCRATLRIGVRRSSEGEFEAHAWVDSEGTVVVGGGDETVGFQPLEASSAVSPSTGS